MIFTSLEFLALFVIILIVRIQIKNLNTEKWFLLIVSWLFYMSWNAPFVILLIAVSTSDYFLGRQIHHAPNPSVKKFLMASSLVIDLGIIGFFKYATLTLESWRQIIALAGIQSDPVFLEIILPIGVSFFTFHSLSYTFDIYRGRMTPVASWRDYNLFIAFFPVLIAGPILKAVDFLPQLLERRRPTPYMFECGLAVFLLGAVKKSVLSDQIAPQIDLIFAAPTQFDAPTLLIALIGFSAQIFLDFSGYSDMAIGCACMMGFTLMENFRMPYSSINITEFWHRWHISLSNWLRDYVYISFGGNRHGTFRTHLNLMATMLLGGLWHGASWNFVLWGGIHGVALVVHKLWTNFHHTASPKPHCFKLPTILACTLTLSTVILAWIPFRCLTFHDSYQYYLRMVDWELEGTRSIPIQLVVIISVVVAVHLFWKKDVVWYKNIPRKGIAARAMVYSLLLTLIVIFGVSRASPFIYFQF